ncbi:MAG: Rossmann-like and DUF2520 domain-containing protein [Agromyces sp.]
MSHDGRLGVGVIGGGSVGPVLASALAGAGHQIVGIHARSDEAIERIESMLPGVPILDVADVIERSELVVIAIPDDQLADFVSGLAVLGVWQPGQIVLHTSARFGADVLQPAVQCGAIPLAVHPALAFTGTSMDVGRLNGCYMAVTGPTPVLPIGQALAVEMGAEPIIISEQQRPAYADAVETVSSFSTAIINQATDLLAGIGVAAPGRVLSGLVRSSVENALRKTSGPDPDVEAVAEAWERE